MFLSVLRSLKVEMLWVKHLNKSLRRREELRSVYVQSAAGLTLVRSPFFFFFFFLFLPLPTWYFLLLHFEWQTNYRFFFFFVFCSVITSTLLPVCRHTTSVWRTPMSGLGEKVSPSLWKLTVQSVKLSSVSDLTKLVLLTLTFFWHRNTVSRSDKSVFCGFAACFSDFVCFSKWCLDHDHVDVLCFRLLSALISSLPSCLCPLSPPSPPDTCSLTSAFSVWLYLWLFF